MGMDYLAVHLKYTIPPALLLTLLFRPLCSRLDIYKIVFLVTVAFVSTTPWDSYLIHHKIWGYAPSAILGPTLFLIPAEEFFFFLIQTYNTSLLYLFLSKPVLHAAYLTEILEDEYRDVRAKELRKKQWLGTLLLVSLICWGVTAIRAGSEGSYMGLILVWACPFILFLWTCASQHILSLPASNVLSPILLPTFYLWFVDTLALRRGTWIINVGTKFGVQLWDGLEVEEAAFFLVTNVLIVFGLVAFDYALAILDVFPRVFPRIGALPSPQILLTALVTRKLPSDEYSGIPESVMLQRKSRSFYLASGVFEGRLRLDLISLYSFCRVADDLIDDAATAEDALASAHKLQEFLDLAYEPRKEMSKMHTRLFLKGFVREKFPEWAQAALLSLPYTKLPREPLDELLAGFRTDLKFSHPQRKESEDTNKHANKDGGFPIQTEEDLYTYGRRVAGTVGEMFVRLSLLHTWKSSLTPSTQSVLVEKGIKMGIALQYINIARDVCDDAKLGRVYIPAVWLAEVGLSSEKVLLDPEAAAENFRPLLLGKARMLYDQSRSAIDELPDEARVGARLAVETYMDIGRRLEQRKYKGLDKGKNKWIQEPRFVKVMRMWRAWRVINEKR